MFQDLSKTVTHLIPSQAESSCKKCKAPLSASRRRAIEMELELMGASKNICSDCFNKEAVKFSL